MVLASRYLVLFSRCSSRGVTHAFEMRFTKQQNLSNKPDRVKFIELFDKYAPTLHYYTRVKFESILLVSLNNISRFIKYNVYLVCVSR